MDPDPCPIVFRAILQNHNKFNFNNYLPNRLVYFWPVQTRFTFWVFTIPPIEIALVVQKQRFFGPSTERLQKLGLHTLTRLLHIFRSITIYTNIQIRNRSTNHFPLPLQTDFWVSAIPVSALEHLRLPVPKHCQDRRWCHLEVDCCPARHCSPHVTR